MREGGEGVVYVVIDGWMDGDLDDCFRKGFAVVASHPAGSSEPKYIFFISPEVTLVHLCIFVHIVSFSQDDTCWALFLHINNSFPLSLLSRLQPQPS